MRKRKQGTTGWVKQRMRSIAFILAGMLVMESSVVYGQQTVPASQDAAQESGEIAQGETAAQITEGTAQGETAPQESGAVLTCDVQGSLIQEGAFPTPISEETRKLLDTAGAECGNAQLSDDTFDDTQELDTDGTAALTLEQIIVQGLYERAEQIDVSAYQISSADIGSIYAAVINSHPELYYVTGALSYTINTNGQVYLLKPKYNAADEVDALFIRETEKCLSTIDDSMSDLEKVLAIHDYMVADCEYDYDRYLNDTSNMPNSDWDATGPVVYKTAVCQGYALAFLYYMQRLGIPCETISGGNHMWNLVEVDGQWYHIDCTWDDPVWDVPGRVAHTYFLGNDAYYLSEDGKSAHEWDSTAYRTCTDDAYDSSFIRQCSSQMVYRAEDGKWYYVNGAKIVSSQVGTMADPAEETVYAPDGARWYVWGSTTSYWLGDYIKIVPYGNLLYLNTPKQIWAVGYDGTDPRVVAQPDTTNGYVYGIRLKDGKIQYLLAQEPTVSQQTETRTFGTCELINAKLEFHVSLLDVTIPESGYTYDGTGKMPAVSIKDTVTGAGTLTVTVENAQGQCVATPVEPGNYTVYAQVTEGIRYQEMAKTKVIEYEISPVKGEFESALAETYPVKAGTTLAQITLPDGYTFAPDSPALPTEAGLYPYEVRYALSDIVHYDYSEVEGYCAQGSYIRLSVQIKVEEESDNGGSVSNNNGGSVSNNNGGQSGEDGPGSGQTGSGDNGQTGSGSSGNQQPTGGSGSVSTGGNSQSGSGSSGQSGSGSSGQSGSDTNQTNKKKTPVKGAIFTYGKLKYKVTSVGKTKTVTMTGVTSKKVTSVVIPASVPYLGQTFKVTAIGSKACYGCKKLKKVTIGKYVKTIGAYAFYKDTGLKTISVKTQVLSKIGKKAFASVHKKAKAVVPKKKKKTYTKLLKTYTVKVTV